MVYVDAIFILYGSVVELVNTSALQAEDSRFELARSHQSIDGIKTWVEIPQCRNGMIV